MPLDIFQQRVVTDTCEYNGYQAGEPPIRCEIVQHERKLSGESETIAIVKYWVCDPEYLYYWKSKDAYEQVVYPTITAAYKREQQRHPVEIPLDCHPGENWVSHMFTDSYLPLLNVFEETKGQRYDLSLPFVMVVRFFVEDDPEDEGYSSAGEEHYPLLAPTTRGLCLGLAPYDSL